MRLRVILIFSLFAGVIFMNCCNDMDKGNLLSETHAYLSSFQSQSPRNDEDFAGNYRSRNMVRQNCPRGR